MKKLFVLLAVFSLALTACGGPTDERQAYIDATIEATCAVTDLDSLSDEEGEAKMESIYAGHGLPVDDEAAMDEIFRTYQNDAAAMQEIADNTEECRAKIFEEIEEAFGDLEVELEELDETLEDLGEDGEELLEELTDDTDEVVEEKTDETVTE